MRRLTELRLEWTNDMSRLTLRAITFIFAIVGWAPTAAAQEQVPAGQYIVVGGGIKPETVSLSLEESCFGTKFHFAIVNRPDGSFLVGALRGGRPPRHPEALVAMRNFLKDVRNVRFRGTKCVSANEIKIALDGLLQNPPIGKDNQVSQLFTVHF